jgi:hypothetical protein
VHQDKLRGLPKKESRNSILNFIRAGRTLTFYIFYLHNLHLILLSAQVKEDEMVGLEAIVGEMRNACSILVGKPEGNSPL